MRTSVKKCRSFGRLSKNDKDDMDPKIGKTYRIHSIFVTLRKVSRDSLVQFVWGGIIRDQVLQQHYEVRFRM